MKKILSFVLVFIFAFLAIYVPVSAEGNEWVYDKAQVVSEETEDYIKNLNEEVFCAYKNKPQLGIVVIDNLPDGYSIDRYKLEMFNQYGVGTKEENCGMLFVFAINDRKYGFETGDGFEKDSLLRKELSKDFITSDMKTLLKQGDYDTVVLQVAEHLEKIMTDEENGVYAQKEEAYRIQEQERLAQLEAQRKAMEKTQKIIGLVILALIGAILIITALYLGIRRLIRKTKIKTMLEKHHTYVLFINEDEKTLTKYFLDEGYTVSEIEILFIKWLHRYYLHKEISALEKKDLKNSFYQYKLHLENTNDLSAFENFTTKDLDTIIYEVDEEVERVQKIDEENRNKIKAFVEANKHRIIKDISIAELLNKMKSCCVSGVEISHEEIENAFVKGLNELCFRYEYEKFIEENKGNINSEYFDSSEFYDSLRKTKEYENYSYKSRSDYSWMIPMLWLHMQHREREVIRIRKQNEEAALRAAQNLRDSSSSFGGGFGGGHSSGGGGFSGGW